MTDTETINAKVEELLSGYGVSYEIRLIGDDCPPFCEDRGKPGIGTFPRKTHIHGQHYQLMLTRTGEQSDVVVDFWNSYHDVEVKTSGGRATKPTVADILSCAELFVGATFEEWCDEYGHDSDSRKAERIYQLCAAQARDFQRMFKPEELWEISELVQQL